MKRTSRGRRIFYGVAFVAMVAGFGLSGARPHRGRVAGGDAVQPRTSGMVPVTGGTIRIGTDDATARHMFDECVASSPQRADGEPPCGARFEDSAFTRQVAWAAAPVKVEPFALEAHEVARDDFARWLGTQRELVTAGSDVSVRFQDGELTLLAKVATASAPAEGAIAIAGNGFVALTGTDRLPMTWVSWYGATAYCKDHGERLPSEIEWEFAARGPEGRAFPWGDAPPAATGVAYAVAPCAADCGPMAVDASSGDHTPAGVFDLAGNVTEWTASDFTSPGAPERGRCEADPCRVVRGGSYRDPAVWLHGAIRGRLVATHTSPNVGFRCALGREP